MANISTYLQKIMAAVYGEEVRGSIHDALAAMNTESSNAMQFAATAKDSAKASAPLRPLGNFFEKGSLAVLKLCRPGWP